MANPDRSAIFTRQPRTPRPASAHADTRLPGPTLGSGPEDKSVPSSAGRTMQRVQRPARSVTADRMTDLDRVRLDAAPSDPVTTEAPDALKKPVEPAAAPTDSKGGPPSPAAPSASKKYPTPLDNEEYMTYTARVRAESGEPFSLPRFVRDMRDAQFNLDDLAKRGPSWTVALVSIRELEKAAPAGSNRIKLEKVERVDNQ